ncbi:MAG TPA: hypothetical protein PLS62_12405 [Desulfobacteraceae bacterium]|nr:hypothetical protein [Desulfobacteraceae bacterium]
MEMQLMPSDYDKIRADNILEYGQGTRHLSFLGRLYTDRTHFIFELLQNAEDASASKVLFQLFEDKLEVFHNGRLFDENDVRGICGVGEGTKSEDLTQIGKFGIGFKSVYAYTTKPEIHSGDESFRIENYVRPCAVHQQDIGNSWTTLFTFPFNKEDVEPAIACREISKRLRKLSARPLLFIRKIKEIEYSLPDGMGGAYLRDEITRGGAREVTVIGQNNGEDESERWLIFERPVEVPDPAEDCPHQVPVEIGFRLKKNYREQREEVVRVKDSPLVVFFPTEKETRFGFLIQGPYKTTPARDNIPKEDVWNTALVHETACLIADVLPQLKDLSLLDVSLLEALPIRPEDFPADGMFYPIFKAVSEALETKELIPADDGSFASAQEAKLARGEGLRNLLIGKHLQVLFKANSPMKWLTGAITQDRTPDLRLYLMDQLKIEEVRPEKFIDLLTDNFLKIQADSWIIQFYSFLGTDRTDIWKKPNAPLRRKAILRLEDNTHVVPFKDDGTPNAYLPSTTLTNFPTIKKSIFANEASADFLKRLGLIEPDLFAELIEFIIPKYTNAGTNINIEENINDLKTIKKLLNEPHSVSSSSSLAKLRILLSQLGLENYENGFSENGSKQIVPLLLRDWVLPSIPLIKACNGPEIKYKAPKDVYENNSSLKLFFHDTQKAWFISDDYPDDVSSLFEQLGINKLPKVKKQSSNNDGFVIISEQHGYHRRGLKGFDPDIEVEGLDNALAYPTVEKSMFIWNKIVLPNAECIRGTIEKSSRQTYEKSSKEEHISESFGRLLIDSRWLPGTNGKFHWPGEISLNELPDQFERSEKLVGLLSMKKDIVAKLAEEAGVNKETIELVRELERNPDLLKSVQEQIKKRKDTEFPTQKVIDPDRRKIKVNEDLQVGAEKQYEKRTRSVRVSEATQYVRTWLQNQYKNKDGQMVCQICKKEMPFKKLDGEYYFEAVEAFTKDIFTKEHEAQFLTLCPLCAAMYKELVKKDETAMAGLRKTLLEMDALEAPLRLGDLETSIKFVEAHLCDIKTILEDTRRSEEEP